MTFTKYLIYDPATKRYLRCDRGSHDLKWTPQMSRASSFLFKMDALLNLRLAQYDVEGAGVIEAEFTVDIKRTITADPRLVHNDKSFDSARKKLDDYFGTPVYHV